MLASYSFQDSKAQSHVQMKQTGKALSCEKKGAQMKISEAEDTDSTVNASGRHDTELASWILTMTKAVSSTAPATNLKK